MPRAAALIALACVLVLSACGPPAGSPTPVAPPPSGLGVVETPNPRGLPVGAKTGSLAPNFRLEDESGAVLQLSDLRGTPVLLNFWATWCGPCKSEMPEFQRLSEELDGRLRVVAVDVGESKPLVASFKEELDLTFATPIDRASKVVLAYGLFGLPATYLIDAEGVVKAVRMGPFVDREDIEQGLKALGL